VIFMSPSQGKVSVIISPLTKVTRLVNPQVDAIGTPEKLIESFGPYITGDTIDVSNDVVSAKSQTVDGQVYYTYELLTCVFACARASGLCFASALASAAAAYTLTRLHVCVRACVWCRPTALSGAHNVAALTFKGGVSVLCVASASDKQWDGAQADLRAIVSSFRVGQRA
jgi:hypothetical protein